MRVGLIGPDDDAEVELLRDRLEALDADPFVVDLPALPDGPEVTLDVDQTSSVRVDGAPVDEVAVWYARRLGLWDPTLPQAPDRETWSAFFDRYEAWHAAETERAMLAGSLLEVLDQASAVVNPPAAITQHLRKHFQLARMRAAGVPVPAFTVTTDPDRAAAFAGEHDRVVYKPMAGRRHVLEVTPEDVREREAAFATEPVTLQRLVEGEHHRVHVVGDEVVAAGRIDFDREHRIDYRASEKGVDAVELPERVEQVCVDAMRACGMSYTGLDLVLGQEPWILECNPAPMFAGFEEATGTDVSRRLAEHLVEVGRTA